MSTAASLVHRYYVADATNKHLWLRVRGWIENDRSGELRTRRGVEERILAHGLNVHDKEALKVLAAGIDVMLKTSRLDEGVPFEIGKKVRSAMATLNEELPELIALEQARSIATQDGRPSATIRYKLILRLIDWIMKWTFLATEEDLSRPKTLWHTDAKWLACALNQTCGRRDQPLTFSAQGGSVYVSDAAKLLRDWIPGCPAGNVASVSNTLAGRDGARLKAHEHFGEQVKYPLHAYGWEARIASTYRPQDR